MYKFHPIADVFPLLENDEYKELRKDIEQRGQIDPIILYENMILDGRNRFLICKELGIQISFEEYDGDDPTGFVIAKNILRRHLTGSQRGAFVAELVTLKNGLKKNCKDRNPGKNVQGGGIQAPCPGSQDFQVSQDDAARIGNVSRDTVQKAVKLKNEDPERFKEVKEGKKSLNKAINEINNKTKKGKSINGDDRFLLFSAMFYEWLGKIKTTKDKELLLKLADKAKKAIDAYVKSVLLEKHERY